MDPRYISRKLVAVKPSDSIVEASKNMSMLNISALAVVDESGKMVGIITERDITKVAADGNLDSKVEEYMTREVIGIDISADIREAAKIMAEKGIRHLPVTEKGKVVGIISIRDVAKAIAMV